MNVENEPFGATSEFSLATRKLIGERIRRLWISSGEQQDEFVKSLGISTVTLSNYMTGKRKPDSEFLFAIRQKLNICLDWLLTGDGPMHPGTAAPPAPNSAPTPRPMPETPVPAPAPESVAACCTKREEELEMERRERRELTAEIFQMAEENRKLTAENRHLWKENGDLREKCARLEERQYQRSVRHGGGEAVDSA